ALGRADAVERATLQVVNERLARLAQMVMGVDDRRHHGLAGQTHVPGARRDLYLAYRADLLEARAVHEDHGVLDGRAPVAHDESCAHEGRHTCWCLPERWNRPDSYHRQGKKSGDGEHA